MELYQLKAFVAVAQDGSLTKASERLYLSLPAVSAQIKALEDELGLSLFERTSRGMSMTAAGFRLFDEAKRTLDAVEHLKGTAAEIKGQLSGHLNIGTLSDSVPLRVGDALLALNLHHPNIGVTLHQDVSGRIVEHVRHGKLDGGFALADPPPADLSADKLAEIDLVVALPAHLAARAEALTREDVAWMAWIVSVPDCALHAAMTALLRPVHPASSAPHARYIADSDGSLRSMIGAGLGAGILRRAEAVAGAAAGELAIWPHWQGKTGLYWVQGTTHAAPAISALRNRVLACWHGQIPSAKPAS